jgi:hypothetical protein
MGLLVDLCYYIMRFVEFTTRQASVSGDVTRRSILQCFAIRGSHRAGHHISHFVLVQNATR